MKKILEDLNKLHALEIYDMRRIFAKIESHIIYYKNNKKDLGALTQMLSNKLKEISANKSDKVLNTKTRFIISSLLYLMKMSENG